MEWKRVDRNTCELVDGENGESVPDGVQAFATSGFGNTWNLTISMGDARPQLKTASGCRTLDKCMGIVEWWLVKKGLLV